MAIDQTRTISKVRWGNCLVYRIRISVHSSSYFGSYNLSIECRYKPYMYISTSDFTIIDETQGMLACPVDFQITCRYLYLNCFW